MKPLFIDVEASGLGRGSYPIEVGVAMECGATSCMIIHPEPDWLHWDEQAEQLHGISRTTLMAHGRSVIEVARLLNQLIGGQIAYSDAWGNDSSWLAVLYESAGIPQQFRLESLRNILTEAQVGVWHESKQRIIEESNYTRHRASNDALILQKTWLEVTSGA